MSGSSLSKACAHVKESLARPIPGIADAGKNAVMKVVIGSGRMNGILRDWGGDSGTSWRSLQWGNEGQRGFKYKSSPDIECTLVVRAVLSSSPTVSIRNGSPGVTAI